MSEKKIAENVRKFLSKNIHSVTKLEILLLLARNPQKRWTAEQINSQLRSNDQKVLRVLAKLIVSKLIVFHDDTQEYAYAADTENDLVVQELIKLYATFQVRIIQLIYETPESPIQQFADAFKLRKEEDDGNEDPS